MAKQNKLTEKQRRFVDYYIQTANASEAARRAGYSAKTAFRIGQENMQKPAIKSAIEAGLKKLASARIAGMTEVMERLTSHLRQESTEEVVVVEGDGDGCSSARIIEKHADIRSSLKAAELIARLHQDHVGGDGGKINFTFIRGHTNEDS